MSEKRRRTSVKWESSTEEDEVYESKCRTRLREPLKNAEQPSVIENETVSQPRKRGRGPSKRPCLNRNALMARENRLKKKAYLEKIENKLSFYQQENKNLVNIVKRQSIDIRRLSGEVSYLRSVLNNNTNITVLLKTINDGLRKINTQKKSLNHSNHVSNQSDAQHKCTCCANTKENVLNSQNTNVFINSVNHDSLEEDSITESQNNGSYVNTKSTINYVKSDSPNKETNMITSTTSSISEDSYLENTKELDSLLPLTQDDLSSMDMKKEVDPIEIDLEQLSTFNMDIFDDLPKCDDMLNTIDNLNYSTNLFTEEEISQCLDNTGICLHVNSDKVSLEFCSICHLNSKNSGLN